MPDSKTPALPEGGGGGAGVSLGGSIDPPEPLNGVIQGGWGGCSGSGIAPDSDEPMGPVSPPKGAGDGRNGGNFVFRAFSSASDVRDTPVVGPRRRSTLAFPGGALTFDP